MSGIKPENRSITAAVERTLEALKAYRRGDVVPWSVFEESSGFHRPAQGVPASQHWAGYFTRLRRRLLKPPFSMCLWHVGDNGGMEILTVDDWLTRLPLWRREKANNQLRKERRELVAVPRENLSLNQMAMLTSQLRANKEARRGLKTQLRLAKTLAKPSAVLPRRPQLRITSA